MVNALVGARQSDSQTDRQTDRPTDKPGVIVHDTVTPSFKRNADEDAEQIVFHTQQREWNHSKPPDSG